VRVRDIDLGRPPWGLAALLLLVGMLDRSDTQLRDQTDRPHALLAGDVIRDLLV